MLRTRSIALAALLASACSGSTPASEPIDAGEPDAGPTPCTAIFSGNYVDSVTLPAGCARLQPSSSITGDWNFILSVKSTVIGATTDVSIDLGPSPAVGSFSDASISTWSTIAVTLAQCEYSAGNQGIPPGNFTLTLTDVSDLGATLAHGTLHLEQHVSAPAMVDCGAGDVESIDFKF